MAQELTTNNITADGEYHINSNFNYATVLITGDFGGGTLKYQASFNDTDYVDVPYTTITADAIYNISTGTPHGKFVLTGATNPNIKLWVKQVY